MDSISIETRAENDWVKRVLREEDVPYIWTGGRKCNFRYTELTADQCLVTDLCAGGVTGRISSPPLRTAGTGRAQARGSRHPSKEAHTLTDNKCGVQEMPLLSVEQDRGHRGGAA